jgi:preprotein translocase subunit SecD
VRRAALALVLCVAGAACDDGDDSRDRRLLELRPVLATTPPPCPDKAPKKESTILPLTTEGKVECLELGGAVVDATDVRSASVGKTPAGASALSVVLGREGGADLDGFAERHLGKRLAILVDGNVVNAPEIRFPSFSGRVQVTGLSPEKTDDLFQRLNKLIKPG